MRSPRSSRASHSSDGGGAPQPPMHEAVLQTLESYAHLPHAELIYISPDGVALAAPPDERSVLHLGDGLHPSSVSDHREYPAALEAALGKARSQQAGVPQGVPVVEGRLAL